MYRNTKDRPGADRTLDAGRLFEEIRGETRAGLSSHFLKEHTDVYEQSMFLSTLLLSRREAVSRSPPHPRICWILPIKAVVLRRCDDVRKTMMDLEAGRGLRLRYPRHHRRRHLSQSASAPPNRMTWTSYWMTPSLQCQGRRRANHHSLIAWPRGEGRGASCVTFVKTRAILQLT